MSKVILKPGVLKDCQIFCCSRIRGVWPDHERSFSYFVRWFGWKIPKTLFSESRKRKHYFDGYGNQPL